MRSRYFVCLSACLTALIAACGPVKNQDEATGGSSGTAGSAGAGGDAGSAGAAGGAGDAGAAGSGGAAGGGSGGTAGGGGGAAIQSCTSGALFSGSPYFDGDLSGWSTAGQDKLADPPLRSRHLAVAGSTVFYETNFEVWRTDGNQVKRLAGDENALETMYKPSGACGDAAFITIYGIAALPNGNVAVADTRGNGIVELQNPTGNCTALPIAGNTQVTADSSIVKGAADPGDVDGPGASAKFFGVQLPVSDAAGNLYVDDPGNAKLKKIGNDAARTVTTLASYGGSDSAQVKAMAVLNGFLYVSALTITDDIMWRVDVNGGQLEELYRGRGIYPDIDENKTASINAMTTDGTNLIVGAGHGYLWLVAPDGKPIKTLAGRGNVFDFPTGLDFSQPMPADQLPLKPPSLGTGSIAMMGSHVLFNGANAVGYYQLDITCQ